jgi:hypothetical protein
MTKNVGAAREAFPFAAFTATTGDASKFDDRVM